MLSRVKVPAESRAQKLAGGEDIGELLDHRFIHSRYRNIKLNVTDHVSSQNNNFMTALALVGNCLRCAQ